MSRGKKKQNRETSSVQPSKGEATTHNFIAQEQLTDEQVETLADAIAALPPEALPEVHGNSHTPLTSQEQEFDQTMQERISSITEEEIHSSGFTYFSEESPPPDFRPQPWTSIPCPIPADPSMGDKDPAVMAWYRDNAPEEFARRYENRVTPHSGGERHAKPEERGPVSDFDDESETEKKPKVIME